MALNSVESIYLKWCEARLYEAQRIRLDRASAASHDLNRLLDKPGPQRRETAEAWGQEAWGQVKAWGQQSMGSTKHGVRSCNHIFGPTCRSTGTPEQPASLRGRAIAGAR